MFRPGSFLKRATKAVGIQPCSSCNRRARSLDQVGEVFSRRGFIAGVGAFAGFTKMESLRAFWSVAGGTEEDSKEALGFVRTLNSLTHHFWATHNDTWPTKLDLLGQLLEIKHRHEELPANQKPTHAKLIDNLNLDPQAAEILPGWVLDYDVRTNGYVFTFAEAFKDDSTIRKVFVTDDTGVIWRADQRGHILPAKDSLTGAGYPGVIASAPSIIDPKSQTWLSKLLDRWGFTAYATLGSCSNCCQTCSGPGCAGCAGPNQHNCNTYMKTCTCFNCGDSGFPWCCFGGGSCGSCCSCGHACSGCGSILCTNPSQNLQCCNPYCPPSPNCGDVAS